MKRVETIKEKKLFNNIIKEGKFKKNKYFVIYYKEREDSIINYGIAISNKVGHAHTRNLLKRRTRAIIDNNRILFKKGFNYIIMIRKTSNEATYEDMSKALISLLEK